MPIRFYVILTVVAVGAGFGCSSGRNVYLKPEGFFSDYIYHVADKGSPHDPDKLTLRANGKYIIVHMPAGHPWSTEDGVWRLEDGPAPEILLDHVGYPIEVKGESIRLHINDDLGWSYEKTK